MTQDFQVRRPGHSGKPSSSRMPQHQSREKNETTTYNGVGEFSPNMTFEYKADPPIVMECIHCHQTTYMYYSLLGEDFQHELQCSLCGKANGTLEEA